MRKMIPWLLAVGLLAGVALACGGQRIEGEGESGRGQETTAVATGSVSGILLQVNVLSSPTPQFQGQFRWLLIQDDSGKTWRILGKGYRGVLTSHVREHFSQEVPVTLSYHEEGEDLVLNEIFDFVPGEAQVPHP